MLKVVAVGALVGVAACENKAEREARAQAVSRTAISAESAKVAATVVVATGSWDDAQLVKRLVDAGLAPQRRDTVHARAWLGVPVHAFTLGSATLDAYIYRDSLARRDALMKVDPLTWGPRGQPTPWGTPHDAVVNNNLFAMVVGGSDRQRDRIATALAAGVGAP